MPVQKIYPETLNHLIDAVSTRYHDLPAVGMAYEKPLPYGAFKEQITLLSQLLLLEGIKKRDRVAILAENSPNWGIVFFAVVRIGAIVVPILPDFPESDVHHILAEAKVKILFTTQRQINKIYELVEHRLQKIITLDESQDPAFPANLTTFLAFIRQSETMAARQPADGSRHPDLTGADDTAAFIYTSGTSGHSKAVMLSHGNLCANAFAASQLLDVKPDWTFLSILPMSHTYEFTIGFLLPLLSGARIVYAGAPPTPTVLEKICQEEKPSVICVVPMIMEKIYKKKVRSALSSNPLLRSACRIPGLRQLLLKKIGRKLLDFFGGRLQLIAIGGAAFNIEAESFFHEADFPYLFGYGLTEASPLLSGGPFGDRSINYGSTGKPVPGVEIKIVDPDPETGIGGIYARGPNIMQGYYKNEELTRQTIDRDGWLDTGDLGLFDNKNNLWVKGRSKSVIVLSHGENIYPEPIEEKINSCIHVNESLVVESGNRLEAIIYLDYDLIDHETRDESQQAKLAYIESLLKKLQLEINEQLPPFSRINRFVERREPFVKTATHKIKRYLYAGSA